MERDKKQEEEKKKKTQRTRGSNYGFRLGCSFSKPEFQFRFLFNECHGGSAGEGV